MKKLLCVVTVLLALSVTAFAGNIPEELLGNDDAKLFFGTVESCTVTDTKSVYSDIDTDTVVPVVIPTEKVKGDVEIGVSQTFGKCYVATELQPDTEYLFAYIDENNFYIYEIESRKNGKVKLVNSDKFDMEYRIQQYINDGEYENAEEKRQASLAETEVTEPVDENDAPDNLIVITAVVGLLVLMAGGIAVATRKSK